MMVPLKPLFNFSSVIDINLSLLKLLIDKYDNPEYFKPFIHKVDDYYLKCIIVNSETKNPLYIFLNEEHLDKADDIYNMLLESKDLKHYYMPTSMMHLIPIYKSADCIDPYILCKNDEDADILKNRFKMSNIIVSNEPISINKKFDTFYMGDINDINKDLIEPEGIIFKVLSYKYNKEIKEGIDIPKVKPILKYIDLNTFAFIEPYASFILPEEQF